ncbi:MAG: fucose isomerase [Candidatus Limiplasma sp.]|nr:fucose isomerase [Candidatus Limiplasma sp.]
MLNYEVKIGLAPMRRDVTPRPGIFNWEKAEERGRRIVKYIEEHFSGDGLSFVDLEGINPVAVMYNDADAEKVTQRFVAEKVDAVMIINCNFGNEEIAAVVARDVGKPVLIWAPMDDEFEPDGMRYTDSQCGLFGVSRQLQRNNIPFSYIETCAVEDALFAQGLRRFASVACMVKNFRGLRVAQVGMRPKPFCSVIFNEGELLQKFGIQVIPVNLAVIIDKYNRILAERDAELEEGAKLLLSRYEMDELTPPLLKKVYAFVLLYQWVFEEYRVRAVSAECWTAMQLAVGAMPCTAYSILADMGYIVSCESDMHGAITMLLLACAARGKKVPFFGEFTVRHPQDRNGELLWHCGPFAYSLKKEGTPAKNVNMRQWFQVKDGQYTIARFEQDKGDYTLLAGTFESMEGPYTFGTYLWARFDDLPKWERKLVEGPYIHHMAEVEGDLVETLGEFCKYVPGLRLDTVR